MQDEGVQVRKVDHLFNSLCLEYEISQVEFKDRTISSAKLFGLDYE